MSNRKISELTELATTPADGDLLPIVDISDTTDSANGTTKKVTISNVAPLATTTIKGKVKLSTAPASATEPIAVGDNDPRVPTADENNAMAGGSTFGTPSSSNKFLTQDIASSATFIPVVRTYLNAASPATWTKPAGLKYVIVEVQAGGGGGGGNTQTDCSSGGGGGGGYSKKLIAAATLGATETVTIGAGGAAGAAAGGAGGTGGASSFGTHATTTGGAGGGAGASDPTAGGNGGIGSSGDINIKGSAGQNGSTSTGYFGGGNGGSCVLGGGGLGGFGSGIANTAGSAGNVYGGGGGGGQSGGGGDAAGGIGAAGIVIVTEYYI